MAQACSNGSKASGLVKRTVMLKRATSLSNRYGRWLFAFLLAAGAFTLLPLAVTATSENVEVRELPAEELEKLLNDPTYIYDRIPPRAETLWDRFWRWLWDHVGKIFNTDGKLDSYDIVSFLIVGGIVALLVWAFMRVKGTGLFFGKKATAIAGEYGLYDENIHEIDFDSDIAEAVKNKDYRNAVRLHFLKLLKTLADKEFIDWKLDKTNKEYHLELKEHGIRDNFKTTYQLFEHVWYGDIEVKSSDFDLVVGAFENMNRKIS